MSANCNDSPYLYGHWKALRSEEGDELGGEWKVQLDANKCDWDLPRWWLSRLLALPNNAGEAEIRLCVYCIIVGLFPELRYPDIAVERHLEKTESGKGGFIDIYCQGIVFEIKKHGNLDGKSSETLETPRDQAHRYLRNLPVDFSNFKQAPRCCVTDGLEWRFYYYDRQSNRLSADVMIRYPTSPRRYGTPDFHYYDRQSNRLSADVMLYDLMNPRRAGTPDFDYSYYEVDEIGLLYKIHSFVSGEKWGDFVRDESS